MTSRSHLDDLHRLLGAKFVDFGSWEMPVQYESVLAEHRAVREGCGWFDVSHLGRFRWEGQGASAVVDRLLCNGIERIEPGRAQYTMMLNGQGGVIDDLILWRWDDEAYWIIPNASNHERVMARFRGEDPDVVIEDLRPLTVSLAIQGPEAPTMLARVLGAAPRRFRTFTDVLARYPVRGAGTGYTGEDGGEVVVEPPGARALIEELTRYGAVPCGLGARDTLRLEAGLPLWGADLDETVTPIEAGFEWVVSFDHDFVGRAALEHQLEKGVSKRLIGFRTEGRQIPRPGYRLRSGDAEGSVTSGNFSPNLERGIGMGYLAVASTDELEVEIRGRWIPAEQVELPFVPRR